MRDKLLEILIRAMAVYAALAFGLAVIVTLIIVGPLALAAEGIERLLKCLFRNHIGGDKNDDENALIGPFSFVEPDDSAPCEEEVVKCLSSD